MQRILKNDECQLLNNLLSYFIQLFLGIVAISSLIFKRHIENPKRPWTIWACDVSKQLVGGFCVHCTNILVSELLKGEGDECAWYFINFFIDCTFGVCIVYLVHDGICYFAKKEWKDDTVLSHIGTYGNPPQLKIWFIQISVYLFALLINKIIVASLLYVLKKQMIDFGNWLFEPLQSHPNTELVVVMILCPWLLTTFQFWVFDHLLKEKNNESEINLINEDITESLTESLTDSTKNSFSDVTLSDI
tara:strand:+ start:198 stop:938 length:741 start_codon:yes stop_codon:yes gene_type:complete